MVGTPLTSIDNLAHKGIRLAVGRVQRLAVNHHIVKKDVLDRMGLIESLWFRPQGIVAGRGVRETVDSDLENKEKVG